MSALFQTLQDSAFATSIREDWFPYIESVHVVAIVLVVGTIFMVDFRVLGLCLRQVKVGDVMATLLHWTWATFVVAVITGSLMFVGHPDHYLHIWTFPVKIGLIVLAGVNMLVFHFMTGKTAHQWDGDAPPPARVSASISVLIWSSVIAAGRWIGFF